MGSGKENKIRKLFIILIVFLPIQYGYVGIVGEIQSEPWPAFVFPGFKNVYSVESSFEIEQYFFRLHFDDLITTKEVRPQELFPELPLSQMAGFVRTHFQDAVTIENLSDEAVIWLYRLSGDYSGLNVVHMEIVIRKNRYVRSEDGMIFDSVLHEEFFSISRPENE